MIQRSNQARSKDAPPANDVVPLAFDDHPGGPSAWPATTAVLIHGWACSRADWAEFINPLCERVRVITVDLRGHGDSPPAVDYSLPAMTHDVAELLDALNVHSSLVVTHSAGSEVAGQLAASRPDLVARMVVVDPAYGIDESDRPRMERVATALATNDPREIVTEYFQQWWEPPELAARHRAEALNTNPRAIRGLFEQFAFGEGSWHFAEATRAHMSAINIPILAIYRNAKRAQDGASLHPGPLSRVLNYSSGHWAHQEHPQRFLEDIDRWMSNR